jgi:O-antigen ligase
VRPRVRHNNDLVSILAGRALRLAGAAILLSACITAATSTLVPWWLSALALCIFLGSLWRPEWAILLLVTIAPWGARLADVPVRATEYMCAAYLAAWLLRIDRSAFPSAHATRAAAWAALAYGGLAVLSWSRLTYAASVTSGGSGVSVLRLVPSDYLITAGRDPHTAATLQILIGIALCLAVATLVARQARAADAMILTLALGGIAAAAATLAAVPIRYWMTGDSNELIRYFVVTRSRYAFHVPDVNAAGSHFLFSGLLLLGAVERRFAQHIARLAGLVLMFAALWISGSRAAMAAAVLLVAGWYAWPWLAARWRGPMVRTRTVAAAAAIILVVLVLSPAVIGNAAAMSGSASRSMSVREEFLVTSARMLAQAPVFGVGVGTYYQRSSEFMPPGIRRLYGRENAHDYFLQTAAELGLIGAAAFVSWLGAALIPLWRQVTQAGERSRSLALMLGCLGFLLTCVTGHPLLVIEVSVPFWAALGVAMSAPLHREKVKVY